MVSSITGMVVQRNKAIVGRNAFAHESGIHQDGMLKERSTYEIMRPEDVGVAKTDLVLGKHSGRHALARPRQRPGLPPGDEQFETLFNDFKTLADKKKEVYDEDLIVLIEKQFKDVPASWRIVSLHTMAGTSVLPTATVSIQRPDGEVVQDAAIGDGPVDAIFKAVERVTVFAANLREFVVRGVTQGKDAQGEVTLELEVESGDRSFRGRAASTDIVEASAEAYLNAVNAIATRRERDQPREVIGRPGAGARGRSEFSSDQTDSPRQTRRGVFGAFLTRKTPLSAVEVEEKQWRTAGNRGRSGRGAGPSTSTQERSCVAPPRRGRSP